MEEVVLSAWCWKAPADGEACRLGGFSSARSARNLLTVREMAEIAGVTRETVTRWLNHHPAFHAAYAAPCSTLASEVVEQARAIRAKASAVVLAKLDGADLPTALATLRAVGPPPAMTELGTHTAPAMLVQAHTATGINSPAPPRLRGDGLADLMGQMDGSNEVAEHERLDRLTLTRLADASGIDPVDLDPPALAAGGDPRLGRSRIESSAVAVARRSFLRDQACRI